MSNPTILINGLSHGLRNDWTAAGDLAPLLHATACAKLTPGGFVIPNTDLESIKELESLQENLQTWVTTAINSVSLLMANVNWEGMPDIETRNLGYLLHGLNSLQSQSHEALDCILNTQRHLATSSAATEAPTAGNKKPT